MFSVLVFSGIISLVIPLLYRKQTNVQILNFVLNIKVDHLSKILTFLYMASCGICISTLRRNNQFCSFFFCRPWVCQQPHITATIILIKLMCTATILDLLMNPMLTRLSHSTMMHIR